MLLGSKVRSHVHCILLASLLATAEAAPTLAQEVHKFDVATPDAAIAIQQFGTQSGVQILADAEALRGLRLNTVTGEHSIEEGLRLLLAGTGYTYKYVGERGIALVAQADAQGAGSSSPADSANAEPEQTPSTQMAGFTQEEVVVVGSRLKTSLIQSEVRVKTFLREDIERLGVTNVADVLNYLPQQTVSQLEFTGGNGARPVRLRGLGLGTTLVLINGRRTVTSALTGSQNYFDLNTVPLAAIDRIEVLSESASAVYGADAVGGVLNIVLKQNVDEPFVDLYFGSASGGADEARASIGYGQAGERYRFTFIADAFNRDPLLGTERERFNDQDYRRFGGQDRRSQNTNPANISSVNGQNLPGLSSPIAAVPAGSTGVGLTPADFQATAGTSNLQSPGQFSSIVPEAERYSGALFGEVRLLDRLSAFGEFLYVSRDDERQRQPGANNLLVPATNPFNPFGVPVIARYSFNGVGLQRDVSETDSLRGTLGLQGAFGDSYEWEVSVLNVDEDGSGFTDNLVNLPLVNAALASRDPNTALNVFQDGPGGSPELLASLAPRFPNNFESKALQETAFVRGPLPFSLPAGSIDFVVGAENRTEDIRFENNQTLLVVDAERDTYAAFTELRVPLVSADMKLPAVDRLALTLAGRYDHYNDFGGTFNPQYGLQWLMMRPLLFRASYSTSFRAPSLFELYRPPLTGPSTGAIFDPARGGMQTANVQITSGGNPNLNPEESNSVLAGFVITPFDPDKLRIAVSYWDISTNQRVLNFNAGVILANEAAFPDRVVRAPPSPTDIANNQPGQLLAVNTTSVNFGRLDTNGVDLELSTNLQTRFGRFMPSVAATWINQYEVVNAPNTPVVDRLDRANADGSVPNWKGTATVAWLYRGLGLSTTARYVSGYDDFNILVNAPNGLEVESQTLVDMQASLDFDQFFGAAGGWADGFRLRLGVQNLFDEDPPFSEVAGIGLDPSQADLRQRFGYMMLSKSF
jgi:iron complex outermembrane recepter protein